MKNDLLIDAIKYIDYDLIEEYSEEKEKLKRTQKSKRNGSWIRVASIAASFCLIFTITFAAILQIQRRTAPLVQPVLPGIDIETNSDTTADIDHRQYIQPH